MDECLLEGCHNKARRKFCCNKHKDRYHNLNNPRGYFAHLAESDDGPSNEEWGHPFESGYFGHGQE